MEFSVRLLFILLNISLAVVLVLGQDQSGFISLDCGSLPNTSYSEQNTGIHYTSDANFVATGVQGSIKPRYRCGCKQYLQNLRSFPEGSRNCYSLNLAQGDKYLIRATFLYGNYDGLNYFPKFDLHLGPNFWTSVAIENAATNASYEMIHVSKANHLQVCLVKTGNSTPFISALELRQLPDKTYPTRTGSLQLVERTDFGSTTNQTWRYPTDAFDRYWTPHNFGNCSSLRNWKPVGLDKDYDPPEIVMQTASVPEYPNAPMKFSLMGITGTVDLYVVMHIAELQELNSNETREFNVLYNGKSIGGPYMPLPMSTTTKIIDISNVEPDANGKYEISLQRTKDSTRRPLLNAWEFYTVNFLSQAETDEKEGNKLKVIIQTKEKVTTNDLYLIMCFPIHKHVPVYAMLNIKSGYDLNITSWEGDPCAPRDYRWDGLNCSYNGNDPPMITSLNLSSRGLTGTILNSISDLKNLEILDLSNNSLNGSFPKFLAEMKTLKVINLSRNMLKGSVPASLVDKARGGSISMSIGENPELYASASRTKKKKKTVMAIVVAPVVLVLLLVGAPATLLIIKRDKKSKREGMPSKSPLGPDPPIIERTKPNPIGEEKEEPSVVERKKRIVEEKKRRFTYSEVLEITNDRDRFLGKGGFGEVYYGIVDNKPVAVKMLTRGSDQGIKEFKAEVELLLNINHKNLTKLEGYCDEVGKLSLIYEFMEKGDLRKVLSGERGHCVLTWEKRLRIVTESAEGLMFLHTKSKPTIIHRDVKTTNILLDNKFEAKLADFGLSRCFPDGNPSHITTRHVAGTYGYLDPEYHETGKLSYSSDVYSFGVVLLEVITSKPVIDTRREPQNIGEWVNSMLKEGDISTIVDPKLRGNFDARSVMKAVNLATACLKPSTERPTMSEVVRELEESLKLEKARNQGNRMAEIIDDPPKEPTPEAT